MPAAALVNAGPLTGVHIADPALNRVALFSSAIDGAAPSGTIAYTVATTAEVLHLLVNLSPGARYDLSLTANLASQTVTLTPDPNGSYQTSSQGVLSFTTPGRPRRGAARWRRSDAP
jgi:hypothetical protein